jgi:hypothetical protein
MRGLVKLVIVLVGVLLAPAAAFAQGAVTGVVKDTSGAVLPGVTVEAASPALIEKVRSAVTDGTGHYQIVNLAPGLYSVTFTLPGFATSRREGIALSGSFVATVNADLRVGALEETITVTGETPVVDVQSTTRQRVMDREVLDTIPTGSSEYAVGVLVPGVTLTSGSQDVGGSGNQGAIVNVGVHGSKSADTAMTLNGVSITTMGSSGSFQVTRMNRAATQEIAIDTAALNAEQAVGGVRINQIPREGGNTFNGTFSGAFANDTMQGNNFTQELRDRGLRTPNSINKTWDLNAGFGGPIKRDRIWFYFGAMYTGASQYAAGLFHDRNFNNPNAWTFDPDLDKPASNDNVQKDGQLRVTWQISPRNKFGFTWHEATMCFCPLQASVTSAVERESWRTYPLQRFIFMDWTSPITSRLLLEVGGLTSPSKSNILPYPGLSPLMIGVTEQSTGLAYRAGDPFRLRTQYVRNVRGAMSYITGAHAFKVGVNHTSGYSEFDAYDNQPLNYRVNNGVPNQLTQRAYPWTSRTDVDHGLGLFAQDKWTVRGLTVGAGVRYDYFANSFPEQHVGPAKLAATRDITFPAQKNLSYHDITPKLGLAYDPFGTGKTAIKVSLNKYLASLAAEDFGGIMNPVNNLVISTTRSWNDNTFAVGDPRRGNFVADCDLTNTAANGECGQMGNTNFGKAQTGASYDPHLLRGWGKRNSNWEFSTGLQQELLARVAADVTYFRRWYRNFPVIDDLAVGAADFTPFSFTAPSDPRLPDGGGYLVSGNYNVVPSKFGVPVQYFVTLDDQYGKQYEYWHGVDVSINARPRPGMLLQGGFSTGRTVTDACEIVEKVPENSIISVGTNGITVSTSPNVPNTSFCHQATNILTQAKFLGSYTIPKIDVQIAGTFQSLPGPKIEANYNAPNALVSPSLGRPISGNQANVTVGLVQPGTMYGDRLNQLDLRFGKTLRFSKIRTSLNVDLYNALNANPVLTQNNNFGAWQQPTSILLARFVKVSAQFDF